MHTKYYNSYLLVDLDRMRQNVDYLLGELPRGVQLVPVLKDWNEDLCANFQQTMEEQQNEQVLS